MADGSVTIKILAEDSEFKKGVQSLGDKAKSGLKAVTKAGAAASAAFVGLSAAAIKVGADFETGMSKVAAISGATGSELEALTAKAEEMGAKTKFSATQSAEALQYMAMAGWKTEDMLSGIEGIMNLAAASGEDLALTSDIVTDALTAFGLSAKDSGHFADVLATASSNANTNVSMMGATFRYAAPIAGALGYSIEDTAIAIGLMANAGIKAEQAGTALRSVLTRLVDPPKDAADALDALGISATNADGTMRSFRDVLTDLRTGFSGLNESQKAAFASSIAGTEAMSGLLAVVNASQADFDNLARAVDNADGAAAGMAETMQDNLQGQITILKSGLEGLGIQVYNKFESPMKEAAKTAIESISEISDSLENGKLSGSFDKLAESTGSFIAVSAELAADVLPGVINGLAFVASHTKEIITVVGVAAGAVGTFKAAMVLQGVAEGWKAATVVVKGYTAAMAANNAVAVTGRSVETLLLATMSAKEIAVGVLTGKIKLATAAQLAWNLAMTANPIGVVVAAVAALVGGIALLSIALNKEATQTEIIGERIDTIREKVEAETESRKQLAEARQESIDAAFSEIDYAEQMIAELDGITDANGKVKKGLEDRAAVLTEQINSIIPNAISLTNQEGAAYVQTADNLELLIQKKRLNAAIEAREAEYNEARQKKAETVKELTALENELTAAKKNLLEVQQEYNEAAATDPGIINRLESDLLDAKNHVKELEDLCKQKSEAVSGYYATIEQQEMLMEALVSGSAEQIAAALETVTYNFKYATNATKEELVQQAADVKANLETVKRLYAEGMPGITAQVVAEWQALSDKADAEAEKAGASSMEIMVATAISTANSRVGEFSAVGAAMVQGVAAGINNNRGLINSAIGGALSSALAFAKKNIESHSPSKRTKREIGLPFAQGIAVGIKGATGLVASSVKGVLETASDTAVENVGAIGERLSTEVKKINSELERMETEDAERKAVKELAQHEKRLNDLYEKLGKAEKEDQQKVLDEIEEQKDTWNEKQAEKQRKANQEALKEQKKAYDDQLKEYENAVSAIESKRDSMAEKLAGFGDLYGRNEKSGKMYLKNLDENIKALERYDEVLQTLVERGAPKEFMEMFSEMDIETGLDFGGELINLSEEGFSKYVEKWEEQQQMAKGIASRYYRDDLETLESDFAGKLSESLSEVPETTKGVGRDSITGWINGMLEKSTDLYAAVRRIAQNMVGEMKKELEINSPSKKTGRLIGEPVAQGIEVGFGKEIKQAYGRMRDAVALETAKMSAGVIVSANQRVANETSRSRTEVHYSHTTTEKTPVIEFGGSLAGIARALEPHIRVEQKRIGKNVIKGVTT